jgi:hypothetical protein
MQEQLPIVRVQFFLFAFIDLATSEVSQLYEGAQLKERVCLLPSRFYCHC